MTTAMQFSEKQMTCVASVASVFQIQTAANLEKLSGAVQKPN
jgi:PIN domain nuclease of toxin-antitoxin system